MGATPNYGFPFPELADTPDVPRDMGALAGAVDAALDGVADRTLVQRGTALPSSPVDGQLFEWVIDDAAGIQWLMRYNAAAATYRWEFVGGPPGQARLDAEAGAATLPAYSPSGPAYTIPHSGQWLFEGGAYLFVATGPGGLGAASLALLVGATPPAGHRPAQAQIPNGTAVEAQTVLQGTILKNAVVQPGTAMQSGTSGSSQWRWMRYRPLRVAND